MKKTKAKKPMGFAAMSPERRREIARMGGLANCAEKNPGCFSPGDPRASAAGKKGGAATGASKARSMKGKQRVKPTEKRGYVHQSLRGIDQ